MLTVQRRLEKFKLEAPITYKEPLAELTTFRVGGPAEVLARPQSVEQASAVLAAAASESIPVFVLGGGANIVVSDRGISGLVLYTGDMRNVSTAGSIFRAEAGSPISDVAATAANWELRGLDFIFAMPGSVGGAVWMNARCYGGEIASILRRVEYLHSDGTPGEYVVRPEDFAYKISPFQDGKRVITAAEFNLTEVPGERDALWHRMREIEEDRRAKGHFAAPCAGSIFKNNRDYGEPSGKIIDRVGLRGLQNGNAMVSAGHGNIIINTGGASAWDIRSLVTEVQKRVYRTTGFRLEPEVLFVGDW
ncbi:MAG: UDP-N-acetylmuramate dehydrogenase [Spirochaetales bacterium]|nr:UDP-N-acetylmuramate dehydrogenase [Spirochaetales bacterium]